MPRAAIEDYWPPPWLPSWLPTGLLSYLSGMPPKSKPLSELGSVDESENASRAKVQYRVTRGAGLAELGVSA